MTEIREQILNLLENAESVIPLEICPDLPPKLDTIGASEWYDFEHEIWKIGEDIRQLLQKNKSLRSDAELQRAILHVATNPKAKRGRQSFIMLLGYTCCAQFSHQVAEQLNDSHVTGHVIDTLIKMKCSDFPDEVAPFTMDKTTWIRNKAKMYMGKYGERANLAFKRDALKRAP